MVSKSGHLSLGETTYSALISIVKKKKCKNHDSNFDSKRKIAEIKISRKKENSV